ncbi:uncharacterized protein LOC6558851 [Drosophila grimshawi]|uniref:uncharacterized protein LOC6558851 n=1 Tax=Drosophila grimshawi TaxID=7222 RepID=UPI000C8711C0|nr:uncharacterized protein LOC6558851 [Drosophila grimshawi]
MFRIIVIFALATIAAAAPGYVPQYVAAPVVVKQVVPVVHHAYVAPVVVKHVVPVVHHKTVITPVVKHVAVAPVAHVYHKHPFY